MLLGGYSSCQGCGCVPCKECTRTCTEPHTGDAFEVVYTKYTLGVQAGNLTDGYLTAEGDNDTSDPVDGMDGSGPWYQRVSGGFTLGGPTPGTRFPCSVRVSFWRTSGAIGANNPNNPPSTALTENTIEVIVSSGALRTPEGRVITPADGAVSVSSVPSYSSSVDPLGGEGTVSFFSQCSNVETIFTVRATIRWATQNRQHTLYGIVRECYDDGTLCSATCEDGQFPPPDLYLTISGLSVTGVSSGFPTPSAADVQSQYAFINATFVLSRVQGLCTAWIGTARGGECDPPFSPGVFVTVYANNTDGAGIISVLLGRGNDCLGGAGFRFSFSGDPLPICGTWSRSGTSTDMSINNPAAGGLTIYTGSFNWSITS